MVNVFQSSNETLTALSDRPLAHNFLDTGIKLHPTDEDVLGMGLAFQKLWNEFFVGKPDRPVTYIGMFFHVIPC